MRTTIFGGAFEHHHPPPKLTLIIKTRFQSLTFSPILPVPVCGVSLSQRAANCSCPLKRRKEESYQNSQLEYIKRPNTRRALTSSIFFFFSSLSRHFLGAQLIYACTRFARLRNGHPNWANDNPGGGLLFLSFARIGCFRCFAFGVGISVLHLVA